MGSTSDIRKGLVINYKGELVKIIEFLHIKTARGGTKIRTKMKNIRSGQVIDNTFRSGEKIETVRLEAKAMQYLYHDGLNYIFMDNNTYEQIPISEEIIAESAQYLKENEILKVLFNGDNPIDLELPIFVELKVIKTDPGIKGDTVSGGTKPATLETDYVVNVPLFINEGDILRIDTRDGNYSERVN